MIDVFSELDSKFNIVDKKNLANYIENEEVIFDRYDNLSINKLLEKYFHSWKLNNNYNDLNEMLKDCGVYTIAFNSDYMNYGYIFNIKTENDCYRFLQFYKNALDFLKTKSNYYNFDFEIVENKMKMIIDKINLSFEYDESKGRFILIENKPFVREIAQHTNKSCAMLLYEYNAIDIQEDIEKKKSILVDLAYFTEPITKNNEKNSSCFQDIYKRLDFALNNFNIRHNNIEGKNRQEFWCNLSKEEKIKYYNYTYDIILLVLAQNYSNTALDKIDSLKQSLKH